jgi:hypothetical protein
LIGLQQAAVMCQRLDAAERDVRKAHAAFIIACHAINRVRLSSFSASRRCQR